MTYTPEQIEAEIRRLMDDPVPTTRTQPGAWARDPRHPDGFNRGGVAWYDAPLPWRWHRCRPWSRVVLSDTFRLVERCACGGMRLDGYGPWINRNERRNEH